MGKTSNKINYLPVVHEFTQAPGMLLVVTGEKKKGFGSLHELRSVVPDRPLPEAVKPSGPTRAVIRMERKQRRGKEVTVIDKLELRPADLETWCRELKKALGCGGAVENGTIVLQGDLRQRLPELLTARGVGKVTIG
jgi:translation initiation factor 1